MSRINLLRQIRHKAGHLAFSNIIYNWSLGGSVPHRFICPLSDTWPGDAERGRWLCSGAFAAHGEKMEIHGECWEPIGISENWLIHMHGFEWLRDLKALGGDTARMYSGALI